MDSGNSGSMQSSSGGDEEFDSRAESITAFFSNNNSHPIGHVGPMPNPPPPPASEHHHHSSTSPSILFDPLSNYFDPLSLASRSSAPVPLLTNPNPLLSLDVWSKSLRSEPNCTDFGGGFMGSSSSSPTQHFFTNQTQGRNAFSPVLIPTGVESATRSVSISGSNVNVNNNDQTNNSNSVSSSSSSHNIGRNPKKRPRASRRAPTTVLTTDTTNFRAMVQEFTGIPAPPFTSSPFPISRLDLFATAASTLRSAATHFDPLPPPPYLLRPFAQKVQPQQPPPPASPFLSPPPPPSLPSTSSLSTSIIIDAMAPTTTTNISPGNTSNSSTSVNHQLPSDSGLLKLQQQNLLTINMRNPVLNFQSLLQAQPNKYPLPNSSILGTSKPQQQQGSFELPSDDSHLKIGGLEHFGLSHGHVGRNLTGLQNVVSSSSSADTPLILPRTDTNPANWEDGVASNEGDHQGLLRTNVINNGNYNNNNNNSSQRVTNGKVNYSASSMSEFHGDKGPENVPARSEGMVESWICSSD